MNNGETVQLTVDGLRRLHEELLTLKERRGAFGASMSDGAPLADAGGDPYGDLARLNHRIAELQHVLLRAVPVDEADRVPGTVGVGSRVTVRWEGDDEETYTIVGSAEVAPRLGRISYESPVGQALVGRRSGEHVAVMTADGLARLEIVAVDGCADAARRRSDDGS